MGDTANNLEQFRDPQRTQQPRDTGLTHVMDSGLSVSDIKDMVEVSGTYVDILKLGWGTSVVVENLADKIRVCQEKGINLCCGGTLFEIAYHRNRLDDYIAFLKDYGFSLVEISDGTLEIPAEVKLREIERLAKEFRVLSEVGSKDETVIAAPYRWVQEIQAELEAGAWKVVTEGRESGTVGLYRGTGEPRMGLIEEIANSIDVNRLIFEAPQKSQQVWFVKHFGANVNLGNIAARDVISVETIRQGLRADTFAAVLSGS